MSMRLGLGLGLTCRGWRANPGWKRLLTLAADDGWTAVYDPTNLNTRTLRESGGSQYLAEIADGLGNLPALVQATESGQPELVTGAFGQLDGAQGGTGIGMFATLSSAIVQPYTWMVIARATAPATDNQRLVRGEYASGAGSGFFIRTLSSEWRLFAGADQGSGHTVDTSATILAALANGASSVIRKDSAAGTVADSGTRDFDTIDYLRHLNSSGTEFIGPAGVLLIREDVDTGPIGRMEDLLHTLTGIAKA